ncbi:hypothetical protein llap_1787 [Limosa lapponica baueri]|uniref:Uncharacterized protein n=1 Tax=Limosa lapponica baueri TaxID=1758121 RepID=A0A2I0UPH7_LIMLA|nr:hypothetical protein llap_1787 [Limosa lapponica baueri]
MDFCVVQQVQEASVIVTGCQLDQLPNKIHIKSDRLCKGFKRCVVMETALHGLWTGLEQSSFTYTSPAPLLSGFTSCFVTGTEDWKTYLECRKLFANPKHLIIDLGLPFKYIPTSLMSSEKITAGDSMAAGIMRFHAL